MRVVVAGCGRVGREVALGLVEHGDDVSVIDVRREALDDLLGRSFDGTVHVGRVYDVDTLRESGIEDADVFLALTNSDNVNLMAVQIAKEVFDVPRAIARLDDPHREAAYRALGVSFVAGASLVSEVFIERVHEPDFSYHLTFPMSTTQVVEMVMGDEADGLPVGDLEVVGKLRVAALQRDGEVVIPEAATELLPGDVVVAAAVRGMAARIKRYLRSEDA
jgi:trk system potassium uptake protein TrkA